GIHDDERIAPDVGLSGDLARKFRGGFRILGGNRPSDKREDGHAGDQLQKLSHSNPFVTYWRADGARQLTCGLAAHSELQKTSVRPNPTTALRIARPSLDAPARSAQHFSLQIRWSDKRMRVAREWGELLSSQRTPGREISRTG